MPGGLLHRHFTLTGITSGGMLSVALSFPEIYSPASFVRRTSRPAESGLSSPVKNGAAAVTVSHTHILYIIFPEIQEKTTAFVQDKQTDGAIPQMHRICAPAVYTAFRAGGVNGSVPTAGWRIAPSVCFIADRLCYQARVFPSLKAAASLPAETLGVRS